MKKRLVALCLPLCFMFASNANSQRVTIAETVDVDIIAATAERGEQERRDAKNLALLFAPIKSAADLQRYIESITRESSPLGKMSDDGRDRFMATLKFNEKGLTSVGYADLVAELSASEIYSVLSLFGNQHLTQLMSSVRISTALDAFIMSRSKVNGGKSTPEAAKLTSWPWLDDSSGELNPGDRENYFCPSPGTCRPEKFSICTATC